MTLVFEACMMLQNLGILATTSPKSLPTPSRRTDTRLATLLRHSRLRNACQRLAQIVHSGARSGAVALG